MIPNSFMTGRIGIPNPRTDDHPVLSKRSVFDRHLQVVDVGLLSTHAPRHQGVERGEIDGDFAAVYENGIGLLVVQTGGWLRQVRMRLRAPPATAQRRFA